MQLLGEQIRHLRINLGLSQAELAERTQLSRDYVSRLEQGEETPDLDILLRLVVSLKAEPAEMMGSAGLHHPAMPPKTSH